MIWAYAPAGTALAGSGAQAAVLVPTATNELPQILNVHTGEVTTLSNPDGNANYRKVEVATDGFLVYERSEQVGLLFEPNGTSSPRSPPNRACRQSATTGGSQRRRTSKPS